VDDKLCPHNVEESTCKHCRFEDFVIETCVACMDLWSICEFHQGWLDGYACALERQEKIDRGEL